VVAEARSAGVTRLIAVGIDLETSRHAVAAAERHPEVYAAVGHHPGSPEAPDLAAMAELAAHPRVVALGEVGLDAVRFARPLDEQKRWLDGIFELAGRLRLPVSVHVRETAREVAEVISSHPGLRGVIHYFTLDQRWADRFLDLGFHLSFAGVVTRASRGDLRGIARACPDQRLVLETDSPYGNPRGFSGPNRPARLIATARLLARLRGISLDELSQRTEIAVRGLFLQIR
jgi:TatD DNase family protein